MRGSGGWFCLCVFVWLAVAGCRPSPAPTPAASLIIATAYPAAALPAAALPATALPATAYPATALPVVPATPTPEPYGVAVPTAVADATLPPPAYPGPHATSHTFLPIISEPYPLASASTPLAPDPLTMTPLPTMSPSPSPSPTPTPIPTLDFAALRSELRTQGQELATVKIGFHVSIGGNTTGLEEWMRRLDEAGVPFFLKSVDNAQPILFAQELKRASGVPHVLVYRKASGGENHNWDVPNYALPADQAAELHWQIHRDAFPPELDPTLVWLETINEIDRTQAEWLGQFALKTAELTLRDGFNWAAFGWASGEPEPEQWQTPAMLQFLRLAGQNPQRLAIAVHEYSYLTEDIADAYPYKVGRFQELFHIADQHAIPRPTVLITEWGWAYDDVPPPEQALAHIAWASRLYAPYPEVKGAAIWYLGPGFGNIAHETQRLIYPLMVYALQNYFTAPLPPARAPIDPNRFAP